MFGLAPFKQKKSIGNHFFEKWLDLHFEGAALHKTDSLTVLATYLFAVYFQYFTVSYSIYNIIARWHLPFHSFKMKTPASYPPPLTNNPL